MRDWTIVCQCSTVVTSVFMPSWHLHSLDHVVTLHALVQLQVERSNAYSWSLTWMKKYWYVSLMVAVIAKSYALISTIIYAQSYSRQCWLMYLLSKENWNVFFINKIKIAYWIPTITMHLMNFWFFSYRTSIVKLIWLKADGQLSQNAARHCLLSIMHIRNACIFNYINYAHTACL